MGQTYGERQRETETERDRQRERVEGEREWEESGDVRHVEMGGRSEGKMSCCDPRLKSRRIRETDR